MIGFTLELGMLGQETRNHIMKLILSYTMLYPYTVTPYLSSHLFSYRQIPWGKHALDQNPWVGNTPEICAFSSLPAWLGGEFGHVDSQAGAEKRG